MKAATVNQLDAGRAELRGIKPGQAVVYHEGFLARDRERSVCADHLGDEAWSMYRVGKVALTQRRLGDMRYAYIATGCR